jgi:hypothetical protein
MSTNKQSELECSRNPEGDPREEGEPIETQFFKRKGKVPSPPLKDRVVMYDPKTSRLNVRGRKDLDNGVQTTFACLKDVNANYMYREHQIHKNPP